jgi:hypothetical protein
MRSDMVKPCSRPGREFAGDPDVELDSGLGAAFVELQDVGSESVER